MKPIVKHFVLGIGFIALFEGCGPSLPQEHNRKTPEVVSSKSDLLAGEVIQKLKEQLTCQWSSKTVDTFKSGSEDTRVTGIATTFLATMDVLRKAQKDGLNLVITHEPTFYNHLDDATFFKEDDIYKEKVEFLQKHNMAVFRFHDHWHRTEPDGIYEGMVAELGWDVFKMEGFARIYKLPNQTIGDVARFLSDKYQTKAIRVVGDPEMQVSQIGLALGAPGYQTQIQLLRNRDVHLLITGETHEWETVEWVRDAVAQGKRKGLILMGHANSEEGGMRYCADWLSGFIKEVPVKFVAAGDPFWVP